MVKRICIISTVHTAFDNRIFHREARSLRRAGYQVTLIAQHPQRRSEVEGIQVLGLKPVRRRWQRLLRIIQALRWARKLRADCYHLHDPELLPLGWWLHWAEKKMVIYDVHEHYPDAVLEKQWIPAGMRRVFSGLFDRLERALAREFDGVIAADHTIQERFQPSRHHLITVFNFPRRDFFEGPASGEVEPPFRRPQQLIYVGAISGARGLWVMLEMLEILLQQEELDIGLWLIGKFGYPAEEKRFRQRLMDNRQLAERVFSPGIIPYHQVPAYLFRADIGLAPLQPIPKYQKNIPTKLFEYMAAGLPTVGSDLKPIRRYLEASGSGLVAEAAQPRAHAEKVLQLLRSPELQRTLSENGKQAFRQQYNWDREEKKLLDFYQQLTAEMSRAEGPGEAGQKR